MNTCTYCGGQLDTGLKCWNQRCKANEGKPMSNDSGKPQWEYETIHSDDVLLDHQLNEYGALGWEIFWVHKVERDHGSYYELLAKRLKQ